MDAASKNLYARVFGALAFAAFLMHAGQHLMEAYPSGLPSAGAWAAVALALVVAVAGAWAQARLNAKRAALWTALVINGIVPIGAALVHRASLDAVGGYGVVLLLGLIFGVAAALFTAMRLAEKTAR